MAGTLIGQGIEGILDIKKRDEVLLDPPRIDIDF